MARAADSADDKHREEQARHRAKLERKQTPEVGRVDTAITVAV